MNVQGMMSRLSVAVLLTATTSLVHAQEYLTPEFRSFGSASLNAAPLHDSSFEDERRYDLEERNPWRMSSGLRINPFVSLELGYQDLGTTTGRDGSDTDTTGWSLSGMLSVPLGDRLSPYARVGQFFWDHDREPGTLSSRADGRNMYYGIGLRFGLAEQLNMHFEYERFGVDETELDMGTMNLEFSF